VAEKNARHIHRVFFEGDPAYNEGKPIQQAPGHQEIELALVKLFRVTGEPLYLDMARKFLEIRGVTYVPDGEGVMAPTYAQQHAPVADQNEAVGHAVRATYLYSAMADVGTLTQEPSYAEALERIWGNIVNSRMHITGGLGAVHGIEGFGPPHELPNHHAFNETCAAVGNVFFNYRMFLLHKDAKYLDVAEVALFNNVLAAVNLAGNRFFYVNPLESDGKYPFNHGTAARAPWFGTACCPSNLARLVPQLSGMTYASDEDNLYVAFFAASRTQTTIRGTQLNLEQITNYPNDGQVEVVLHPTAPVRFRLQLRVPSWTDQQFVPGQLYQFAKPPIEPVQLTVNDEPVELVIERGFAVVDREWQAGDRVQLELPMPPRFTTCHPAVAANRGRVAITRGPLVLCAEGVDNGGATQRFFFNDLPDPSTCEVAEMEIEHGSFLQVKLPAEAITDSGAIEATQLILTPYYAWNNRGISTMTVWFPRSRDLTEFDPTALSEESVFTSLKASHTFEDDTVSAVGDGMQPRWSSGNKSLRWSSRPQAGKPQWIEGEFAKTRNVRSVGVYWFVNGEHVKLPAEWSLEVKRHDAWEPFELYVTDAYGRDVNQFNVVRPAAPLACDGIRLNMTPQPDACVGVLEIDVVFEPEATRVSSAP
ncbi:MAG: beta-L-arabinofuranosidase domain-containing protein, partial [Planctomycetota bacterium]